MKTNLDGFFFFPSAGTRTRSVSTQPKKSSEPRPKKEAYKARLIDSVGLWRDDGGLFFPFPRWCHAPTAGSIRNFGAKKEPAGGIVFYDLFGLCMVPRGSTGGGGPLSLSLNYFLFY